MVTKRLTIKNHVLIDKRLTIKNHVLIDKGEFFIH